MEQDRQDDYEDLPLPRWEIEVRFPLLTGFGVNLTPAVGWASPQALRHLLHAVDDHMRREHADGR